VANGKVRGFGGSEGHNAIVSEADGVSGAVLASAAED
jgi:hypothetical protein